MPAPAQALCGRWNRAAAKTCSENRAGFPGTSLPEQPSGRSFSKELKTDGTRPGERGGGHEGGEHAAVDPPVHKHQPRWAEIAGRAFVTADPLHVDHMSMQGC